MCCLWPLHSSYFMFKCFLLPCLCSMGPGLQRKVFVPPQSFFIWRKEILYTTNCKILNTYQNWEICFIQPFPVNQCFLIQQFPICAQWEPSEKCCATWATMSLKGWQNQAIFQVCQSALYFSSLDLCLFLKFKTRRGEVRICRKQYPCSALGRVHPFRLNCKSVDLITNWIIGANLWFCGVTPGCWEPVRDWQRGLWKHSPFLSFRPRCWQDLWGPGAVPGKSLWALGPSCSSVVVRAAF